MDPKYKVGDLVKLRGSEVEILGMIIEILGTDFDYPIKFLNKFDLEVNDGQRTGLYRQVFWCILYSDRSSFLERL